MAFFKIQTKTCGEAACTTPNSIHFVCMSDCYRLKAVKLINVKQHNCSKVQRKRNKQEQNSLRDSSWKVADIDTYINCPTGKYHIGKQHCLIGMCNSRQTQTTLPHR